LKAPTGSRPALSVSVEEEYPMAEETILLNNAGEIAGETRVNTRVLEVIAGLAASEVEGVATLRGSLSERAQEALGRRVHGKGVELTSGEDGLEVSVYVFLKYGVSVPKVARAIQEHVMAQVSAMTALEVTMVNVHIAGVVSAKPTVSVDPNNLFGEAEATGGKKK
jgi:uncharacterized alkaline shock family protein YloU